MKKRVFAVILAMSLLIALAVPAIGAGGGPAAKVNKKAATYSTDTSVPPVVKLAADFLSGGTDGYLYRKTGEATFTSLVTLPMTLPVTPWKQDYEFIAKGGTKIAKFTVAAQPAAPAVKVNIAKGEVKVKKGWVVDGEVIGAAKVLTIGTQTNLVADTDGTIKSGTLRYNDEIVFGNVGKGDGKKPISSETVVWLGAYNYEYYNSDYEYEDAELVFGKDAKDKWIPLGGAAIEMFDGSKGKWAKYKNKDNTTPTSLAGPFRIAGTKSFFPSAATTNVVLESGGGSTPDPADVADVAAVKASLTSLIADNYRPAAITTGTGGTANSWTQSAAEAGVKGSTAITALNLNGCALDYDFTAFNAGTATNPPSNGSIDVKITITKNGASDSVTVTGIALRYNNDW